MRKLLRLLSASKASLESGYSSLSDRLVQSDQSIGLLAVAGALREAVKH